MVRVTLVRHGESIWNASGRWQGQSDVPLSERGQRQARDTGERLRGTQFDVVLTSDLLRAASTAAAIRAAVVDPRLREIDVGAWAGLTRAEVAARFPAEIDSLREGGTIPIGGGESMNAFEARVDALFEELSVRYLGQEVLCVTHGGVIRSLLTRALGLRGRRTWLIGADNGSISRFDIAPDRVRAISFNDAHHLPHDERAPAPDESTTAVVVTDDGAEVDRGLCDRMLTALRIPNVRSASATPLARGVRASIMTAPLTSLAKEDEHFVLLAPTEHARALLAQSTSIAIESIELPTPSATVLHVGRSACWLQRWAVPISQG